MRRFSLAWFVLAALLALTASATAQSKSVKPGINDAYLSPELDVQEWVDRFEGESREIFQHRHAIVAALGLEPGMEVADVGAGTGLFVPLLASAVGSEGQVLALDISPVFVSHLRDRAAEAGLTHVSVVLAQQRSVTLAEDSIDLAFVCDVYHHFEYPADSLASLRRALRPGGTLVVIEFERIEGKTREFIFEHVRAGKEVFRQEILDAGFELVREEDIEGLEENYVLRFQSP